MPLSWYVVPTRGPPKDTTDQYQSQELNFNFSSTDAHSNNNQNFSQLSTWEKHSPPAWKTLTANTEIVFVLSRGGRGWGHPLWGECKILLRWRVVRANVEFYRTVRTQYCVRRITQHNSYSTQFLHNTIRVSCKENPKILAHDTTSLFGRIQISMMCKNIQFWLDF